MATTRSQLPPALNADAVAAMREVARLWRGLLRAVPGAGGLSRAQDFARFFGLKTKLAWQFWRAMNAEGPTEMLEHLPGEPGLRLVWRALEDKAGTRGRVRGLQAAIGRFRELARVHAGGDRGVLAGMLVELDPERRERVDLQHREGSFRAARHLWGVQARTTLVVSIMHPGSRADLVDVVALRATLGFQRLRSDVPWVIARVGCRPEESIEPVPGDGPGGPWREPIFSAKPGRASVIAELSSRPLPSMREIRRAARLADIEIGPGPVGELGSMDIVVGDVHRNLPRFRQAAIGMPDPEIVPIVFTPCEMYVHDLIVHDGAEPEGAFDVAVYGDPKAEGLENKATRRRLPGELRAVRLGRGRECLVLADVPNYRDMMETVHKRLRWRSDAFTVHRIQWRYPITPSAVCVSFRLPEAGGNAAGAV